MKAVFCVLLVVQTTLLCFPNSEFFKAPSSPVCTNVESSAECRCYNYSVKAHLSRSSAMIGDVGFILEEVIRNINKIQHLQKCKGNRISVNAHFYK